MKTQRKIINSLVAALLLVVISIGSVIPAYASEPDIMPVLDNCNHCILDFYIVNGVATVGVDYSGTSDSFTYMKLSVKLQKKTLGFIWTTVDIGLTNDTWTMLTETREGYILKNFNVSKKGTYRAVFDIEFHGNNGLVDEINEKIQYTYS